MTDLAPIIAARDHLRARAEQMLDAAEQLDKVISSLGGAPVAEAKKPRAARQPRANDGNGHVPPTAEEAKAVIAELKDCPAGMTAAVLRRELEWAAPKFKAVTAGLLADGKIVKFGARGGAGYRLT